MYKLIFYIFNSNYAQVQTEGMQGPSRNLEEVDFEICHDQERDSFSGGELFK